jgi:hypothetical protein
MLAACGGGGPGSSTTPMTPGSTPAMTAPMSDLHQFDAADRAVADRDRGDSSAVLPELAKTTTIGTTVPSNGDQNPYGLDIAPADSGLLHRGDLVVCNFNDAANVQGNGTTIVALRPHAGATPTLINQDARLEGCDALALGPTDNIWAAAFVANDNPIVSPAGAFVTALPGGPWHHPFGQAFSAHAGPFGSAAFYETNAMDGTLVRINITTHGFTFDVIASGFAVNGGVPGSILGPSGLQYDADRDALYVIDGADNSVTVIRHVSFIPPHGITVNGSSFGGFAGFLARRIFSGAPLNGPISSALLPGGHLAIGNTLDPTGTNLMVEITPGGRLVATKNVDKGAAGAIFGMVATGGGEGDRIETDRGDRGDTKLYFNDDNDNTVKVLSN